VESGIAIEAEHIPGFRFATSRLHGWIYRIYIKWDATHWCPTIRN